jgi:hypothetical protein
VTLVTIVTLASIIGSTHAGEAITAKCVSRPVRITLRAFSRVASALPATAYDDMTEVVILAVDDTERDFASRAFGVPAFTAATPTMKGTHVVVIDGPGAGLRIRAPTQVRRNSAWHLIYLE